MKKVSFLAKWQVEYEIQCLYYCLRSIFDWYVIIVVVCGLLMSNFALWSLIHPVCFLQKFLVWSIAAVQITLTWVCCICPFFPSSNQILYYAEKHTDHKIDIIVAQEVPLHSFSDTQYIHLGLTVIYCTHRNIHSMEKTHQPSKPPNTVNSSFSGKSG